MISHVHSATVIVADQDKALDFYVNTLGFDKVIDQAMGPEMRFITVVPKGATTQIALALESWAWGSATRGGESAAEALDARVGIVVFAIAIVHNRDAGSDHGLRG